MKQVVKLIDKTSYNLATDVSSVEYVLPTNTSIESCTLYVAYDGAGGGLDGTVKLNISGLDSLANGYVTATTVNVDSASNLTDVDAIKITYDFVRCQAVYQNGTTTGTGTLRVYLVIETLEG